MNRKTILHITPGLRRGGAETMLTRLVIALQQRPGPEHVILSLEPGNAFAAEHQQAGIRVMTLGMTSLASLPWHYVKLRRMVKQLSPVLIHGWMYHGNMAARHAGADGPVIFSIHNALDAWKQEKWTTRRVIRYEAIVSGHAAKIVYCSHRSRQQHEAIGYTNTHGVTIPNGVDTDRFKPDEPAKNQWRHMQGISQGQLLFGQLARYHPIKNQTGLLQAFSKVAEIIPHAGLVLAGKGCDNQNKELSGLIYKLGLTDRVYLLGEIKDVEKILPGLDVLVSPSLSEAFPVALLEAMACGIPCIATDTGDSHHMIGHTGIVVKKAETTEIAHAMLKMANLSDQKRNESGRAARIRVTDRFSMKDTLSKYETLYLSLIRNDAV